MFAKLDVNGSQLHKKSFVNIGQLLMTITTREITLHLLALYSNIYSQLNYHLSVKIRFILFTDLCEQVNRIPADRR